MKSKRLIKDIVLVAVFWSVLSIVSVIFTQLITRNSVMDTIKWALLAYVIIIVPMFLGWLLKKE